MVLRTLARYTVSKTETTLYTYCFFAPVLTWVSECKRSSRRPLSLQVRDSSTKEVWFSGGDRRAKDSRSSQPASESTGENIWRPSWVPVKPDPIMNCVWVFWRDEEHENDPLGYEGRKHPTLQQIMETMRVLQWVNEEAKADRLRPFLERGMWQTLGCIFSKST